MPHPVQIVTKPAETILATYQRRYSPADPWSTAGSAAVPFGVALEKGRDESHKSLRNASGWRNPTPYWGYEIMTTYGVTNYSFSAAYDYRGNNDGGALTWIGSTALPDSTSAEQTLINKALAAFKNRAINLSVSFLERQQTMDMLAKTADRLRNLYERSRKEKQAGRRKKKPRTRKKSVGERARGALKGVNSAGSLWLEYRYGWLPLLSDIYGAVEMIEKEDDGSYGRYAIRASARYRRDLANTAKYDATIGRYYTIPSTTENILNGELQVKIRLDAKVDTTAYLRLVDSGVLDPLLVAWEKVPYSFVVDWFLSVGQFLEASNAMMGLTYQGGSITRFMYTHETCETKLGKTTYERNVSMQPVTHTRRVRRFSRSALLTLPQPKIVINENPLDPTRMMDAIALLAGALGRRLPLTKNRRR